MPQEAEEPVLKKQVFLYKTDCEYMEKTHGWGWTSVLRDLLRRHIKERTRGAYAGDDYE